MKKKYTIRVTDADTDAKLEFECGLFFVAGSDGTGGDSEECSVFVGGSGSLDQCYAMRTAIDNASRLHFGSGCRINTAPVGEPWRKVPSHILSPRRVT